MRQKNIKLLITIILLTFTSTNLFCQNGQNYYRYGDINAKLDKRAISEIAKQEIRRLVIRNKIEDSWKNAPIKNIDKTTKSNNWLVKFYNNDIKNEKKKIVNIVVDESGNIKGAGYSSK